MPKNYLLITGFLMDFVENLIQSMPYYLMLDWDQHLRPYIKCMCVWKITKMLGEFVDTWVWKFKKQILLQLISWLHSCTILSIFNAHNKCSITLPILLISHSNLGLTLFTFYRELFLVIAWRQYGNKTITNY
jgi:hypothetical protein